MREGQGEKSDSPPERTCRVYQLCTGINPRGTAARQASAVDAILNTSVVATTTHHFGEFRDMRQLRGVWNTLVPSLISYLRKRRKALVDSLVTSCPKKENQEPHTFAILGGPRPIPLSS